MHEISLQPEGQNYITEDELINWYCELFEDELENEEQMLEKMREIKMVIKRMTTKDHVLQVFEEAENQGDNKLKKHPNYDIDGGHTGKRKAPVVGGHMEEDAPELKKQKRQ